MKIEKQICSALIAFFSMTLSACLLGGKENDKQINYDTDLTETKNGCVQGSLVDGTTGQPMAVPAAS